MSYFFRENYPRYKCILYILPTLLTLFTYVIDIKYIIQQMSYSIILFTYYISIR